MARLTSKQRKDIEAKTFGGKATPKTPKNPADSARDSTVAKIALERFNRETLEQRFSDSLDFFEVASWALQAALKEAFEAGLEYGRANPQAETTPITYAVKITATMCDNVSFVTVRNGSVSYVTDRGIALSLCNMFDRDSVEFRLQAAKVKSTTELLFLCRRYAKYARNIEAFNV